MATPQRPKQEGHFTLGALQHDAMQCDKDVPFAFRLQMALCSSLGVVFFLLQ